MHADWHNDMHHTIVYIYTYIYIHHIICIYHIYRYEYRYRYKYRYRYRCRYRYRYIHDIYIIMCMSLIPVGFGNWLPPASGHIITVQWSQFGKQKPSYPWHPRLNRFFGHVQKQFSVENEVANSCYITVIPGGAALLISTLYNCITIVVGVKNHVISRLMGVESQAGIASFRTMMNHY